MAGFVCLVAGRAAHWNRTPAIALRNGKLCFGCRADDDQTAAGARFASSGRMSITKRPIRGLKPLVASLQGSSAEERLSFARSAARIGSWELDVESRDLFTTDIHKANWGRAPAEEFTWETQL